MLIEVKVRVTWIVDSKQKKTIETYIIDKEVFAEAEYTVMSHLSLCIEEGTVSTFEIQSLRISTIKEIITQYQGEHTYIAILRDTIHQDDGTEKQIKYKVLLYADTISEAMSHTREIVVQGYDMQVDGLKEVNYAYLTETSNTEPSQCTSEELSQEAIENQTFSSNEPTSQQ